MSKYENMKTYETLLGNSMNKYETRMNEYEEYERRWKQTWKGINKFEKVWTKLEEVRGSPRKYERYEKNEQVGKARKHVKTHETWTRVRTNMNKHENTKHVGGRSGQFEGKFEKVRERKKFIKTSMNNLG